ncbi:MAG: cobaltochelatase subunit CobN, partial [Albidovulum sp.]
MHVIFRESHGLEETDTPTDLGQDPADLVVLSFSDSDLGAFAAGWHRGGGTAGTMPSLRLANLVALRHPLSVDTYAERTLSGAKGILIRLIGGESYWPYGLAQVQDLARRTGIALAVLPADGREDTRLDALSTLPVSTLRRLQTLCDAGGAVAAQAALQQLSLAAGLYAGPVAGEKSVPPFGWYLPGKGVVPAPTVTGRPLAVVTFYRSYLTAADTDPVDALIAALEARGFAAIGAFAASLKDATAADWLRVELTRLAPAAIVNATAFSARGSDGQPSPLDAAGCPVFQVALSTARRKDWAAADRGLSPADLAMHVVLPEVDGRIFAGVASFKSPGARDPDLQYSRFAHRADAGRIAAVADRVAGWQRLSAAKADERNLALILSTYPGKDWQLAHAVGLDALASAEAMLSDLGEPDEKLGAALTEATLEWPVAAYRDALNALPASLREALFAAWGQPETDPSVSGGNFRFRALRRGRAIVALQPERGEVKTRANDYHDLSRTPRHAYVAFYLWLRAQGLHALIHIGAHGTLEWLPGKSVALSD